MSDRKSIPDKERDAVLREAGYCCAVPTCHTTLAIDLHHIIEISEGGGNELPNLLALCPTHHALYHRGVITRDSIKQWKERLMILNSVVDVRSEVQARLEETLKRHEKPASDSEQRNGFSLATAEFYWRTCEVGFVYDGGKRFVSTGFCCFVKRKLAVTVAKVVDWAMEIGKQRGGSAVIRTKRGMAPFAVIEKFEVGQLVAIEMGAIDDTYTTEMLKEYGDDIASSFAEPLQTPIRFRVSPFLGERVGILHSADNSKEHRGRCDFQFDSADVAFEMKCNSPEDFLQFALSPVSSHIQHRGAPVFSDEGRLIGIVNDTTLLSGERGWRPIISPVFILKKLLRDPDPVP